MARKDAEKFWLDLVEEMFPGTENKALYEELFGSLSNQEFDAMMQRIKNKELILPVFVENMTGNPVDHEKIMKIGERLGVKFFQHLYLTDPVTGKLTKTPERYLVIDLSLRRLSHHLRAKISVPTSDAVVDQLTGQATGESKGASITLPELQALGDKNQDLAIEELIKVRGGDKEAYEHMLKQISETGGYSIVPIRDLNSRPQVTETIKHLIFGLQLDNSLRGDSYDPKKTN